MSDPSFPAYTLADNMLVLVVPPPGAVVTMVNGDARLYFAFTSHEKALAFRAVDEFKDTRPVWVENRTQLRDWIAKRNATHVVVDADPARPFDGPFLHAAEI